MNMERVGKKIQQIREWRNLTQAHMAMELGIKQNTYSLWERGKGLTEDGVEAIAKILNFPAEELLSPDPISITMTQNHGNNGYVSIQNQQQHTIPVELFERMLQENRERAMVLEGLVKSQMELITSFIKPPHRPNTRSK